MVPYHLTVSFIHREPSSIIIKPNPLIPDFQNTIYATTRLLPDPGEFSTKEDFPSVKGS